MAVLGHHADDAFRGRILDERGEGRLKVDLGAGGLGGVAHDPQRLAGPGQHEVAAGRGVAVGAVHFLLHLDAETGHPVVQLRRQLGVQLHHLLVDVGAQSAHVLVELLGAVVDALGLLQRRAHAAHLAAADGGVAADHVRLLDADDRKVLGASLVQGRHARRTAADDDDVSLVVPVLGDTAGGAGRGELGLLLVALGRGRATRKARRLGRAAQHKAALQEIASIERLGHENHPSFFVSPSSASCLRRHRKS